MGWDAHSSVLVDWKAGKLKNSKLNTAFKNASNEIVSQCGEVDGLLYLGGLDFKEAGLMLEIATKESVFELNGWSSEKVKELNKKANWNFKYDKESRWLYLSAKKFLEVCAEHNLSITFSW